MTWLKLKLKNFQKYKFLEIKFGPGVTTIVGPSDIGKSAIIRALRWIGYNRPAGTSIIKKGEETAEAVLITSKHKYLRVRGKKGNYYALDGSKLLAFGSTVPTPVTQSLMLGYENLQRQNDPPFWLDLSPKQLSEKFNEIIGIDDAEDLKDKLASRHRKNAAELKVVEEQIGLVKGKLLAYQKIKHVIQAHQMAIRKAEIASETKRSCDNLELLIKQHATIQIGQENAEKLARALEKLLTAHYATNKVAKRIKTLVSSMAKVKKLPAFIEDVKSRFSSWLVARKKYDHAYMRRSTLDILIADVEVGEERWHALRKELKLLKKQMAMGSTTCPTCGQSLSDQKTEKEKSPF